MTDYVPSTEWVRIMVGYAKATATDRTLPVEEARAEGYEWFDRWLAEHDAERDRAIETSFDEQATAFENEAEGCDCGNYRVDWDEFWRALAGGVGSPAEGAS